MYLLSPHIGANSLLELSGVCVRSSATPGRKETGVHKGFIFLLEMIRAVLHTVHIVSAVHSVNASEPVFRGGLSSSL